MAKITIGSACSDTGFRIAADWIPACRAVTERLASFTGSSSNRLMTCLMLSFGLFMVTAEAHDELALPKGSAESGMQVFIDMECTACHTVAGLDLPPPEEMSDVAVNLGGETPVVKTQAALVTAIVNPSHSLVQGLYLQAEGPEGGSKMPNFNDLLTVAQLIDLVTFLEQQYKLIPCCPNTE